MSFLFGLVNPSLDVKTIFASKYGSYAIPYDSLDAIGHQKFNTQWPYFIAVLCFFLMFISFALGSQTVDPETKKPVEKTIGKKFLTGLGILFLLCTLFGVGYGLYLYFAVYMTQYVKWFDSLPFEAKSSVGVMSTLDNLAAQTYKNS
jgi:hypothetical protein